MNEITPESLNAAIGMQPLWLQVWVGILVAVNLAAIAFIATRQDNRWKARPEAFAILISFFAAGAYMTWLFEQVGYVRLLGLPHLVFWTPVYLWLLHRYRQGVYSGTFKLYLLVYFIIAGISLITDLSDVTRYLLGDR